MIYLFALRYLFSKKNTNAINILSRISMLGMGGGAMALIVVLSIFNGFEDLVKSLYSSFQPSIKIEAQKGKYISTHTIHLDELKKQKGVEAVSLSLEENAYFRYGDKECIGTIKGVDENFTRVSKLDSFVVLGKSQLSEGDHDYAILGAGIDATLNVNPDEGFQQIAVYLPKKNTDAAMTPQDAFNTAYLIPGGIFSIQQEFDEKYVLAPIGFVQYLTEVEDDIVTSIEIKTDEKNEASVLTYLENKYGRQYKIRNRLQQNEMLYKIMKIERWAVFAILGFIVFIISFNILGSLSMLVMEKKKDISILKAMGAEQSQIKKIFIAQGVLQSLIGTVIGLGLGIVLCLLQKQFGFIKLGGSGTFVVDAYPVSIQILDVFLVFVLITSIALLASVYPANKAAQQDINFQ